VAPLEPPGLHDGPARPRRHALAEPVGLRPLPGVGLISALHVNSAFNSAFRNPRPAPEPVRCRVHAAAFRETATGIGESLHVRRHLTIPTSRIGPHGVRSSNSPHRDRSEHRP
jgi:hypothetical protein